MTVKNLLLRLVGCFALGTSCWVALAQTNPMPPRVVHFTVFAAEPIDDLGFVSPAGGAVVPLVFYATSRSPRYEHRSRQPLRLVERSTGATIAEVVIPDELREVLLLVAPDSGMSRYRVNVLDDGPRQRGAGQVQILNLSGLELAGELNSRRIPVVAGLNAAENAGRSARLVLRATFRGRSYLSWHDTLTLGPAGRALLVLFPPFQPGSLEVQTRVLLDEPPGLLGRESSF